MTAVIQNRLGPAGIPARILVAGSDLLADALASALETYGFATMNIVASEPAIEDGIGWRPDLVLLDARSLDVRRGIRADRRRVRQMGVQVCVIDATDDGDRSNAWLTAGTSALIDKSEPFEQLFRTITRSFCGVASSRRRRRGTSTDPVLTPVDERRRERLELFAALTDRETGRSGRAHRGSLRRRHCKGRFRLSLHRSLTDQVDTSEARRQLAAGRCRNGSACRWSLENPPGTPPEPSNGRRRRVS